MKAARKSKTNPKFLFWSLVWLITLVIQIVLDIGLVVGGILLHRRFGISVKVGEYVGLLIAPSFITALISVFSIGRRLGFVEPRQTETLRRIPGPLIAPASKHWNYERLTLSASS